MKKLLFCVVLAVSPALAFAHPGRLDKHGGHTNKKTGEYHFHKKQDGSGGQAKQDDATPKQAEPAVGHATVEERAAAEPVAKAAAPKRKKKRKKGGKKRQLESADKVDVDLTL